MWRKSIFLAAVIAAALLGGKAQHANAVPPPQIETINNGDTAFSISVTGPTALNFALTGARIDTVTPGLYVLIYNSAGTITQATCTHSVGHIANMIVLEVQAGDVAVCNFDTVQLTAASSAPLIIASKPEASPQEPVLKAQVEAVTQAAPPPALTTSRGKAPASCLVWNGELWLIVYGVC